MNRIASPVAYGAEMAHDASAAERGEATATHHAVTNCERGTPLVLSVTSVSLRTCPESSD